VNKMYYLCLGKLYTWLYIKSFMNFYNLNTDLIMKFPVSKVEFPVIKNDFFNNLGSPILTSNSQIDLSQQQVKNSNDFSKQILTSGGWMYEKSRSLF
jgi:hypothetical protein